MRKGSSFLVVRDSANRRNELSKASGRRFALLDALLVVAGIGVGMAAARAYAVEHKTWYNQLFQLSGLASTNGEADVSQVAHQPGMLDWVPRDFLGIRGAISTMAVALCVTQLMLRLRARPAPARILATGVGTAACLALCTAIAIEVLCSLCWCAAKLAIGKIPPGVLWWHSIVDGLDKTPGVAVLAVWVLLWLGPRSTGPRDWVELLGLVIGCVLVLLVLAEPIIVAVT